MKGGQHGEDCGIGGFLNAGTVGGGGGVREGNVGKGRGGCCEERVGISGAMMVVNNMKNRANMVEIFGFCSWR